MKRIIKGILIAIVATLLIALPVLALGTNVTNLLCYPQAVSVHLTWIPAPGSTTTVIRYRTNTYPTSYSDGVLSYNGTGYEYDVSGLTGGSTYYFGAWGFDGSSYSTDVCQQSTTTLYTIGLSTNQTIPSPVVLSSFSQPPSNTGWSFEPFTSIIKYFLNSASGGINIPENNAWEWIFAIITAIVGVYILAATKQPIIAAIVVILLTGAGWGLHLMQGYLLFVEVIILLGFWAAEHSNA
jgi:hypothetical protein